MLRRLVPYLAYAYVSFVGLTNRLTTVRGEIRDGLKKTAVNVANRARLGE